MVKQKYKQILIYYIFLQYIKQLYVAQLLSANDDTYTYDSRGNITSKTVGDTVTNFTKTQGDCPSVFLNDIYFGIEIKRNEQ